MAKVVCDGDFFVVSYPDLPGAYAQADSLQALQAEAQRALGDYLYAAELTGIVLPPPSHELPAQEDGAAWLLVTVDMDAYRERVDSAPVRKTVSIPTWMANRAERMGLSLSKVLQESLRRYFK